MASELKMAIAFFLESRSPISSSVDSGLPKTIPRIRFRHRSEEVRATLAAAGLATSVPGP
jgi:hypothetical protein